MEFSLWQLVTDLGIVSILLLIGVIVRAKLNINPLRIPLPNLLDLVGVSSVF